MKNSIFNQLKSLSYSLFILFGFAIALIAQVVTFNSALIVVAGFFLLLPLYLYFEYLYFAVNFEIQVDKIGKNVTIKKQQQINIINFEKIVKIEKYCSWGTAEERIKYGPFEDFLYHKIILIDDQFEIIPCFITFDLEIPGIKTEIKKKFIPSILL